MSELRIEAGKNTPLIVWNLAKGNFLLEGKSFPENAKKFYIPLFEWIDTKKLPNRIELNFRLYYVSSSSIITIYQLIKKFEAINNSGKEVLVNWYHDEDDDDILRIGEDYNKITSLDIKLISEVED